MAGGPISRRDVLKSLTAAAAAGPLVRSIPQQAAEYAHQIIRGEKASQGTYKPKFFSPHQYEMLRTLCELIIPASEQGGGAQEAGAPDFIDLLTSENMDYQLKLGGGMMWLDAACKDRFGASFLDCSAEQRKQILDLIAYRKNAQVDSSLSQGIEFFSFLRHLTADGFFTSEIGIKYLGYIGNTHLRGFPGCPEIPKQNFRIADHSSGTADKLE
jgi:gluconate 2-dehydrogenase gamma chain